MFICLFSAEEIPYKAALPPPMFKFNPDSQNLICATGIDFKAAVQEHEDWYFVNEGSPTKPKWGYVTYVPSASLVIELDSRAQGGKPLRSLSPEEHEMLEQQQGMLDPNAVSFGFGSAASIGGGGGGGDVLGPEPGDPIAAAAESARKAADASNGGWTVTKVYGGGDGVGGVDPGIAAAAAEAERQAKYWGEQMASGQLTKYLTVGERIVGGQGGAGLPGLDDLQQPAQHQFLKGVTVVVPGKGNTSSTNGGSGSTDGGSGSSSSGSDGTMQSGLGGGGGRRLAAAGAAATTAAGGGGAGPQHIGIVQQVTVASATTSSSSSGIGKSDGLGGMGVPGGLGGQHIGVLQQASMTTSSSSGGSSSGSDGLGGSGLAGGIAVGSDKLLGRLRDKILRGSGSWRGFAVGDKGMHQQGHLWQLQRLPEVLPGEGVEKQQEQQQQQVVVVLKGGDEREEEEEDQDEGMGGEVLLLGGQGQQQAGEQQQHEQEEDRQQRRLQQQQEQEDGRQQWQVQQQERQPRWLQQQHKQEGDQQEWQGQQIHGQQTSLQQQEQEDGRHQWQVQQQKRQLQGEQQQEQGEQQQHEQGEQQQQHEQRELQQQWQGEQGPGQQQEGQQEEQQQERHLLQEPVPLPDASGLGSMDMLVWVGYLKSYRQMGSARITCISGCACGHVLVDGFHAEKTSQTYLARLRVSQHEKCRIGVQVLDHYTSTGHFKFKLTSVMVTKYVDYSMEGDFTDQVLMTAIENSKT